MSEIPPEILDLTRFMCETWDEFDKFVYKYCDVEALAHYPVIQGIGNQLKLKRIGEQKYNSKNISKAVNWMLKNETGK